METTGRSNGANNGGLDGRLSRQHQRSRSRLMDQLLIAVPSSNSTEHHCYLRNWATLNTDFRKQLGLRRRRYRSGGVVALVNDAGAGYNDRVDGTVVTGGRLGRQSNSVVFLGYRVLNGPARPGQLGSRRRPCFGR